MQALNECFKNFNAEIDTHSRLDLAFLFAFLFGVFQIITFVSGT